MVCFAASAAKPSSRRVEHMKKVIFLAVALSILAAPAFAAEDMTGRIGLGFVHWDAPIGGRYWFSPKVGVDLGFGFDKTEYDQGDGTTESLTNWRIMGGLPINIQNMAERVHFNFLPAVQFANFANGGDVSSDTDITIVLALECEVNVTPDFTVGASHGFAIDLYSPGADNAESTTDITTFGDNVTEFGFHYYLPK
jgi:hypothetical protein